MLKPNEAMFAEALTIGRKLALIATFRPSPVSMADEIEAMLAQFSMAAAGAVVQKESRCPVLTSPGCAVLALRQCVGRGGPTA